MHLRRDVALPAVAVAFVAGFVKRVPDLVTSAYTIYQAREAVGPVWLPTFGSVGESVVVYHLLARVVSFLAVPVGAVALGYWATARLELVDAYKEYLVALTAAGAVGLFLGTLAVGMLVPRSPWSNVFVWATVSNAGLLAEFVLAAFAGTAFAELRAVDGATETVDAERGD